MWILLSIIVIGLIVFYWDRSKIEHGIAKKKYVTTSMYNPVKQLDGKKWTDTSFLKTRHSNKNGFFLGCFRFSPKVNKYSRMPFFWKKYHEKTEIYLDSIKNLRETTILYSGMGGGKSVLLINLLEQINLYDNALIHDGGKLEMVAKLFNNLRGDIILNPYDERATIVDILDHDPAIAAEFFILLLRGTNKENNFFTKGSTEHFIGILHLTNSQKFESQKEKWNFFIEQLENLIVSSITEKQRSELDVIKTLQQQMPPFLLLNFRIQNDENLKLFTCDEFLDRKNGAKLFVSYPPMLKSELKNFSAAFIHLYNLSLLSKDDTKSKTRLIVVDEMSSYIRMINDPDLLQDQLELPRSKGGCFIGCLQGIHEDPKINDIISKTCKQKLYFKTDGQKTKDYLIKDLGNITYEIKKQSESQKKTTYSKDTVSKPLIKMDDFDELGDKHEYIAQIGDSLYRGYTPLPRTEIEHERRTNEAIKKEEITNDKKWFRNPGFIEYSKRREFENYLGKRYESFQMKKKVQSKIDAAAKAAFLDEPDADEDSYTKEILELLKKIAISAYPNTKDNTNFILILKDNLNKKAHGEYYHDDAKIVLYDAINNPREHLVAVAIHELAHHIELKEHGSTGHSKRFYKVMKTLLEKAIELNLINYLKAKELKQIDSDDIDKMEKHHGNLI